MVINILPAWPSILEKLSLKFIKSIIKKKITMMQFGFIDGGSCNQAKLAVWYNSIAKGLGKCLLIDIKKAFDSIDRDILKNMIENDFVGDQKEILLSFIRIYNSIEIDFLGEKILPTKGGPQGSSIIPILFFYYLENCINKIKLRENVSLQAYADDLIIQATSIKDLKDTYIDIKESLMKYNLRINPDKCELLTDNKSDTIIDEDSGIEISMKETVKYLGQQINHKGISVN